MTPINDPADHSTTHQVGHSTNEQVDQSTNEQVDRRVDRRVDHRVDHPTPRGASTRRRRGTILGVGAGVLGGGVVGLVMTIPTFTNAADHATSADEASTEETSVDEVTRPEPGVRLRQSLQVLVDDGTLTAEQADAVAEHLVAERAGRPDHGGHRGDRRGHRPGMDGEVVAELLGIDASELRSALREGQSIAGLAAANGVDVQVVIDALVAEVAGHLDLAVDNGRLTEDEAAEKLAAAAERITARVNGERPNVG